MCKLSNKLKFCTCSNESSAKHIWVLRRRNEEYITIGEVQTNIEYPKKFEHNNAILLERLKDKDCFDFDYSPKTGDKLDVFLFEKEVGKRIEFNFIYSENKWLVWDKFWGWMEDEMNRSRGSYIKILDGVIKNA